MSEIESIALCGNSGFLGWKEGKIKRINGDVRPFAVNEAGMKDAKYFMKTPVKKATHAYAGSSKQRSQSRVMAAIPTHHHKMKST